MPTPKTNRFTSFEFTEEEMFGASRFTPLNLMLIQTLAAEAQENRTRLKIDLQGGKSLIEANAEFMQQEASLQGQIEAYEHLILLANETTNPNPVKE